MTQNKEDKDWPHNFIDFVCIGNNWIDSGSIVFRNRAGGEKLTDLMAQCKTH